MPQDRYAGRATVPFLDEDDIFIENPDDEQFSSVDAGAKPSLRVRLVAGYSVADIVNANVLFDWAVIGDLSDQLHRLVEQGHTRLLVNLNGIRSMSSDFLATLVTLERQIARAQGSLALCGLDPVLWDMIHICRLEPVFDIYAKESEALGARLAACDEPHRH